MKDKYSMQMWKPNKTIGMIFDDKYGKERNIEALNIMMDDIRRVAKKHGFEMSMFSNNGVATGFRFMGKNNLL